MIVPQSKKCVCKLTHNTITQKYTTTFPDRSICGYVTNIAKVAQNKHTASVLALPYRDTIGKVYSIVDSCTALVLGKLDRYKRGILACGNQTSATDAIDRDLS